MQMCTNSPGWTSDRIDNCSTSSNEVDISRSERRALFRATNSSVPSFFICWQCRRAADGLAPLGCGMLYKRSLKKPRLFYETSFLNKDQIRVRPFESRKVALLYANSGITIEKLFSASMSVDISIETSRNPR